MQGINQHHERTPARRRFLARAASFAGSLAFAPVIVHAQSISEDSIQAINRSFGRDRGPQLPRGVVQEFVRICHFDLEGVQQMLSEHAALLNSSWDWGAGDFETGLGAASHVGNRAIALHLLENGARPSLFSAAMLGQLDVVKAFLTAQPALANCRGPHGLSLIHHARKGAEHSADVLAYLETFGVE